MVKNFKQKLEMTNLKEIHMRLDKETKAQWLELVESMGEKMQSRAFRRIIQNQYEKIELENDGKTGD
jgi:hypothetical protein